MSRFRIAANVRMFSRYERPTVLVDRGALLLVEAAVAPRDGEARGEPLDVPLERAGERLVEVVEAEDDLAVGRGEAAEVRQVRIAAELGVEPGARARWRDPTPSGRRRRGRT